MNPWGWILIGFLAGGALLGVLIGFLAGGAVVAVPVALFVHGIFKELDRRYGP